MQRSIRLGYHGQKHTLERIGRKLNITRERVRQIVRNALNKMKLVGKEPIRVMLNEIEKVIYDNNGIISQQEFLQLPKINGIKLNEAVLIFNLLIEFYPERYKIIDARFLTSLNDDEITKLNASIRKELFNINYPISENDFLNKMTTALMPICQQYLYYYCIELHNIERVKDKVVSPAKLSTAEKANKLKIHETPSHFTNIANPWIRFTEREIEHVRMGLGISKQVMRHYLSGRRRPHKARAMAMAQLTMGRATAAEILGVE